jgi:hypothetical protein
MANLNRKSSQNAALDPEITGLCERLLLSGVTQPEVARRVRLSESTVSRIARDLGKRLKDAPTAPPTTLAPSDTPIAPPSPIPAPATDTLEGLRRDLAEARGKAAEAARAQDSSMHLRWMRIIGSLAGQIDKLERSREKGPDGDTLRQMRQAGEAVATRLRDMLDAALAGRAEGGG